MILHLPFPNFAFGQHLGICWMFPFVPRSCCPVSKDIVKQHALEIEMKGLLSASNIVPVSVGAITENFFRK